MKNLATNSQNVKELLSDFTQNKMRIEIRMDSIMDKARLQGEALEKITGKDGKSFFKSNDYSDTTMVTQKQLQVIRKQMTGVSDEVRAIRQVTQSSGKIVARDDAGASSSFNRNVLDAPNPTMQSLQEVVTIQ